MRSNTAYDFRLPSLVTLPLRILPYEYLSDLSPPLLCLPRPLQNWPPLLPSPYSYKNMFLMVSNSYVWLYFIFVQKLQWTPHCPWDKNHRLWSGITEPSQTSSATHAIHLPLQSFKTAKHLLCTSYHSGYTGSTYECLPTDTYLHYLPQKSHFAIPSCSEEQGESLPTQQYSGGLSHDTT